MNRWSTTLLVFVVCTAAVHADVTIVQKTTVEGGPAVGAQPSSTITTRIKGTKSRSDMDMGAASPVATNVSAITDATARHVIVLDHTQKTARMAIAGAAPAANAPLGTLKVDGSVTPTGKSQTIDGLKCDEYAFTSSLNLAEVGGSQIPAEAAAMMKGMMMVTKGSIWVAKTAPGAAEYRDYQKAIGSGELAAAAMAASGLNMPGAENLMKAMQSVDGLPILTEIDVSVSGGVGEVAEMMKQMMGNMRVITKVLSVKTDAIGDDVFNVPQGYQVIK